MQFPFGSLVLILAQIALAALALAGVFQREPWRRISMVLVGCAFFAFCLGVQHLLGKGPASHHLFWARFIMGSGVILLVTSQVGALTLGRADPVGAIARSRNFIVVQGLAGGLFLVALGEPSFVHDFGFSEGSWVIRLGAIGRIYLAFLLVGLAVVAFRVECVCRAIRGPMRARLAWAAFGMFCSLAYFAYLLTDGAMSGIIERDALIASGVPLTFAAVFLIIAQYRTSEGEADLAIGRQVIHKSLTGVISAAYVVAVLAAAQLAQLVGLRPAHLAAATMFAAALTGLGVFIFSGDLRRRMLRFLDRNFSTEPVDYRTYWLRASHELVSGVGSHALLDRGTILFEDLFDAETITIHLARRAGDPFRMMHTTAALEPPDVEVNEPVVHFMEQNFEPFLIQDRPERHARTADPRLLPTYVENEFLLETTGAHVIAPLKTAERLIGFVCLGRRTRGDRYNHEDMALLETITLQLAGAIRGAWLSEDLGAARDMEVFSQWANVVVHDLKNFVSPLKLFLQNARRHMHNPEFREQAIDDIQNVVEKMDTEIQRLTALRRGEEISPTPTDVHWVIDSVLARAGLASRPGIHIDRRFARLPAVTADPAQLDRVFSNLVANALESMPDGGLLTIETADVREPSGMRWAVARVRDTGTGMSQSFLRHRLFQPFATTKKKGWGLGLYQCRQIIEAHGGTLTATSQEGVGSEFRITLPLRQAAPRTSDIVGPGAVTPGRGSYGQN